MTAKEKISTILSELKIKAPTFAKILGVKYQRIYDIVRGQTKKLSGDLAILISSKYPQYTIQWLVDGEQENVSIDKQNMQKTANKRIIEEIKTDIPQANTEDYSIVPIYNLDIIATMNNVNTIFDNPIYVEKYLPFPGARKGDFGIYVTGKSMLPIYEPGCIVLVRKVERWHEYFGYGNVFALFLADGRRVIKQVQKSLVDPGENILCVSFNPDFPDEELPRILIETVYKVIGSFTVDGF